MFHVEIEPCVAVGLGQAVVGVVGPDIARIRCVLRQAAGKT